MKFGIIEITLEGTDLVVSVDKDKDNKPSIKLTVDVTESIDEVKESFLDIF